MNILIGLYHNMASNSASHVDGILRILCANGHDCAVAVPNMDTGKGRFGATPYRVVLFDDALRQLRQNVLFKNGRPLDIFHAWTPRELLRRLHARLAENYSFSTFIHLEDNEWQVARLFLGQRNFQLASVGKGGFEYPESLTHPIHGQEFIAAADGCTLLIDALAALIPNDKPKAVFWPAVDQTIFHPRPPNPALREEFSIPDDTLILVYSGNMHAVNFREVRSLYLAVHLLNRAGIPTVLIRMGTDNFPYPYGYKNWAAQYTISLGFIENRDRVAQIVNLADILVQPGGPDPFNDLRFPSKLPEFFAMGKPVILPRTNIGLVTRHLTDAYVVDKADGPAICAAVKRIVQDPALKQTLSDGALAFYNAHFSWQASAQTLESFYQSVPPAVQPASVRPRSAALATSASLISHHSETP